MFSSLLIANRGEIACRIIRTARRLGLRTIAVYSDADRDALHVAQADEAVRIGPAPAAQSYLSIEAILAACRQTGAEAVHPGYGFLSEREAFPRALAEAGIVWVGPHADAIAAMGDKIASKKAAAEAGVSTVPGHLGVIEDGDHAVAIAEAIGYPVMLKASAGGGGKGMRIAWNAREAREGFALARSEAASSFGDDRVFVEKFIVQPRHIEIQVMGDKHGHVVHLGERECSIQRRNQKVIEEAPSPLLDAATREAMGAQAVALARAVGYDSAGTVEFVAGQDKSFFFLEMNTRLQVEHPVTELVTGLDLVELMIRSAAGEALPEALLPKPPHPDAARIVLLTDKNPKKEAARERFELYRSDLTVADFLDRAGKKGREDLADDIEDGHVRLEPPASPTSGVDLKGWAVETRIYAEDPSRNFLPSIGRLVTFRPPRQGCTHGITTRVDTGVEEGGEIAIHYDPMIAKLITHAPTREQAIAAQAAALDAFAIDGIRHNIPFLAALMQHPRWQEGRLSTGFIADSFPDGFVARPPDAAERQRLAAVAASLDTLSNERRKRISGQLRNRGYAFPPRRVVLIEDGAPVEVTVHAVGRDTLVTVHAEATAGVDEGSTGQEPIMTVRSTWVPGQPVWHGQIDGASLAVQVRPLLNGYRLSHAGLDVRAYVYTPQEAALARLMPVKDQAGSAKDLLCPMPGVVKALHVREGQAVKAGDVLVVVEAMKMENPLRADRDGTIARLAAKVGDTLAVDAVILAFA